MGTAVAYSISVLSIVVLLGLWFVNAYQVLSRKRAGAYKAQKEMQMHQSGYRERYGSLEEQTAKHILDTSVKIFEQISAAYNQTLRNPLYLVPGVIMGFRIIKRSSVNENCIAEKRGIRFYLTRIKFHLSRKVQ